MRSRLFLAFSVASSASLFGCSTPHGQPGEEPQVDFATHIKPILEKRCVMCHNEETLPGRLNFQNAKGAFVKDSTGRPYIVPGKPEESRLYTAIISPEFDDLAMPPVSHRVSKIGAEKVRLWIAQGAVWPDGPEGEVPVHEHALE